MSLSFFLGVLLSFLPPALRPQRLRERSTELRGPAIFGGVVQMAICLAELGLGYKPFIKSQLAAIDPRVVTAGVESSGETALMGLGLIVVVAYILRPLSIALFYFAFEGGVRAIAAFAGSDIIGTLPLYLGLALARKTDKEVRELKLGPLVRDEVVRAPEGESDFDLRIESCRPKDWNKLLTISYEERLYELVRMMEAEPPRRFVYLLRVAPLSKIVRGLHEYDPSETLTVGSAGKL